MIKIYELQLTEKEIKAVCSAISFSIACGIKDAVPDKYINQFQSILEPQDANILQRKIFKLIAKDLNLRIETVG